MALDPATQLKLSAALYTGALPIACTLAAALPFVLLRPLRGARWRGLAGGVGLALGFAAAHRGVGAWSGLPPQSVIGWLPVAAAAGLLVGVLADALTVAVTVAVAAADGDRAALARRTRLPAALHLALRTAALAGALVLLHRPLLERWSSAEQAGWIGGASILGALLWSSLDGAVARGAGAAVPAVLAVAAGGLAAAIAASGSALVGQLAGALGAAAGALAALLVLAPGLGAGFAVAGAAAPTLVALAAYAYHFADVPLGVLLLGLLALAQAWPAAPPPAAGVGEAAPTPAPTRARALAGASKALAAALVPALLAVLLAVAEDRARDAAAAAPTTGAGDVYLPYGDEPDAGAGSGW